MAEASAIAVVPAPATIKSANVQKPGNVRGLPKSHRPWKVTQTKKFSSMTRPKAVGAAGKGLAFKEQQARKATMQKARSELQRLREIRQQEIKVRTASATVALLLGCSFNRAESYSRAFVFVGRGCRRGERSKLRSRNDERKTSSRVPATKRYVTVVTLDRLVNDSVFFLICQLN